MILIIMGWTVPVAAAPASRRAEVAVSERVRPETDICERVTVRTRGGHGRRPGALVVPAAVHLEVKNIKGTYSGANSAENIAVVSGDEVDFRILVSNLSLYDIENVEVSFAYTAAARGPVLEGLGAVTGARYSESEKTFTVDHVEADSTEVIAFRAFFLGDLTNEVAKSSITLKDFSVASEDLPPQRTPETSSERRNRTGTVERFGIGSVDVACFRGEAIARSFSSSPLPPMLTPMGRNVSVQIRKSASAAEVSAGAHVVYTISVMNTGEETLREITLDDRFSSSHLHVLENGGGEVLAAGIEWHRSALASGDRWIVRYRAEVLSGIAQNEQIPNTATVIGEQLRDTPTTHRTASATVSVIARLPQTGVEFSLLFHLLQVAFGVILAFFLAWLALVVTVRRFE